MGTNSGNMSVPFHLTINPAHLLKSRLFVDYFGDGDERVTFGTGKSQVVLSPVDAGTKTTGYWFRPSETEPGGGNEEQGQLEVGTYLFEFSKTLSELKIDFFDTESFPTTGVLEVNGVNVTPPDYVPRGGNNNIYSKTFTNVNSLVLKLGEDFPNGTGDGVDFRMSGQPVPEPGSLLGLAAISAGGVLLKKRQAEKV
jgi:hypothetical protein